MWAFTLGRSAFPVLLRPHRVTPLLGTPLKAGSLALGGHTRRKVRTNRWEARRPSPTACLVGGTKIAAAVARTGSVLLQHWPLATTDDGQRTAACERACGSKPRERSNANGANALTFAPAVRLACPSPGGRNLLVQPLLQVVVDNDEGVRVQRVHSSAPGLYLHFSAWPLRRARPQATVTASFIPRQVKPERTKKNPHRRQARRRQRKENEIKRSLWGALTSFNLTLEGAL